MKGVVIASVFLLFASTAFLLGLATQGTVLLLAGFCLSPMALVGWGYAVGRAGLTVSVQPNGHQPRRRTQEF